MNQKVWTLTAEIFVPAAASRLVSKEQISQMISSGLEVISPGANVPFADKEIFFGPIMEFTDSQVTRVEYALTDDGVALHPSLESVFEWVLHRSSDPRIQSLETPCATQVTTGSGGEV